MRPAPGWRPPHAYIPGQTARHAEGLFDRFGFEAHDIGGSERWALGLAFLQDGYFWEAHEMFEPIWMALPQESSERRVVQGLIQLANAGLKHRMQRPRAVERLEVMARELLAEVSGPESQAILGLEPSRVADLWKAALGDTSRK